MSPTVEQIEAAIAVTDDPLWSAYLRMAFTTGARRSQILGVHWEDISADQQNAIFKRSVTAADGEVEVKGTKSDRNYIVALDPATIGALKMLREYQQERADAVGGDLGPWVFTFNPTSSTYMNPGTIKHWWSRCVNDAAPALDDITPHQLRHFMASFLLAQGVPLLTVANRLCHADATVTLRVYGHFIPGDDGPAAELIGAIGG